MNENLERTAETSQITNLANVDVESVRAEMVRMHQSAAGEIAADDVDLSMSAAAQVQAVSVKAQESALAYVQAGQVVLQQSGVGAARAENINLQGGAGLIVAGSAEFGNAYAGVVAASEVRGERIESVILLSQNVHGPVTTLIDTRGAVIAGLVAGLFTGILFLLGRMLFGKK